MITPEIINYIKQQITSGVPREQISVNLKKNGWNDEDLNETFNVIISPTNTIPQAPLMVQSHTVRNFIIAIIVLVLLGGGGWLFFQKNKNNLVVQNEIINPNLEVQVPQTENFDDLKISYVPVPADENSASIFNVIRSDTNTFFNRNEEETNILNNIVINPVVDSVLLAKAKTILTKYKNILTSFELGVSKQYYQCSIVMGPNNCQLNSLRDVAKLVVLNSLVLLKEGKVTDARNYAQKIIKLGQMVTAQADDFINLLVGWVIQKNGYYALSQIKPSIPLSLDTKTTLINNLREDHKKVFRFMYTRNLEYADYITDPNSKKSNGVIDKGTEEGLNDIRKAVNSTTWKPNIVKKWFYDSLKIQLSNIDLPCGSVYKNSQIDIGFNPKDTSQTENFVGKTFYSVSSASLDTTNAKRCEIETLINAL